MNTQVIEYSKAINYKYLLFFLLDSPDSTEARTKGNGFIGFLC